MHGGAAGPLDPRQAPARGRGREAAPNAMIADLAPDLLDDVVGVAQIGTPGRSLDGQGVTESRHPAATGLEHAENLLELHLGPQDRGDQAGSQVDPGRHRDLPDDRDVAAYLAAAVFHEQVGGAAGGRVGEPRVDGAFETFGRLRRQPVPSEGVGDAGRGEGRGLQHDGRGPGGDLGGLPAHDAGDPDRAGVVGDQQVIGRERAADAVEGGDLLPLGGEPHPDRSLQFGRVVGVQWLPGLEHHVVGDVHGKGDGTHSAGAQPVRHEPGGRGGRVETLDGEGDERGAAIRFQDDGVSVGDRGRQRQVVGIAERDPVDHRQFAAQSPQRQAVGQVRGHVDVQHLV